MRVGSLLLVLVSKGSKKHMPCMGSFVYSTRMHQKLKHDSMHYHMMQILFVTEAESHHADALQLTQTLLVLCRNCTGKQQTEKSRLFAQAFAERKK